MKSLIPYLLLLGVCTSFSFGDFDFTISDTYEGSITLNDQSLLVTGGGTNQIWARISSYVEVQNTASPLQLGVAGIYTLALDDSSTMNFFGGEIGGFHIYENAEATFSGGQIYHMTGHQSTNVMKHITIVYSGDLPTWSSATNILSGLWGNGDPFSIQLHDVSGYDTTYSNINFIPEPTALALLGLGGLLIRRRK